MAQRNNVLATVDRLERELETQIKESYKEAGALRRKFDDDLSLVRRDAENRLVEHHRLAKKQQAKLKKRVASAEERKAHLRHRVEVLQQQLAVTTNELHLAKSQICGLNVKVQNLRARPPQVVERADPGAFADAARLRDRASVMEQQASRAHQAAREAREAVGREAAINQNFQRDLDNARHRLLTVQGSLAEAVEDNAGLRREIESERVKSTEGSRRLADAVERHEAALDEVRRDSLQLRAQRDSFAQDHAALGVKLRQIEKRNGATRMFNVLNQVRLVSLAGALRIWEVSTMKVICSRQQARQQEKHNSELASLEAQLLNAETLCKITRRENEALRDSRERVAEAVATAGRRRGGMAAAAEERGGSALRWCFWGWARVAQRGEAAVAKKKERIDAQRALPDVREMLEAAVDRAREAEMERDRQSATVQILTDDIKRSKKDLENIRVALEDTQSLSTACRNRFIHFVMVRLHNIMERNRQELLTHAFAKWYDECALTEEPVEESATDQVIAGQPWGRRRSSTDRNAQMLTEPEAAEASTSTLAQSPGLGTSSNYVMLNNLRHASSTVAPLDSPHTAWDDLLAGGPSDKQPTNNAGVVGKRDTPTISSRMEGRVLQVPDVSFEDCVPLRTRKGQVIDSEETRFDAQVVESPNADTSVRQGSRLLSYPRAVIQDGREHKKTNGNCTVNDRGETPKTTRSPSDEPMSDRISIAAAQAPDSPRFILAMRMALGEELYDVGERLMRCVEADHREMHSKPYQPIPLTDAEREQFRACLVDASRGALRRGVVTFLRAQDSDRAVAEERGRADTKTTYSCNGDRVQRKGQSGGRGIDAYEGGGARRMATLRGKGGRLRNPKERRYDLSSLTTGPLSCPAEKAAAARLLRDRLIVILEDANEAWQSRRRKLNTFDFGIESGTLRFGKKMPFATRGSARYSKESCHYGRGGGLDSGAGPRKFWETVTGSRFVEPRWNIDIEVLEEQIWKIATLVRDQDYHHQGLALGRSTHLRHILDLRVYELLLLHVRTRLIWDGIDEEVPQTTS